MSVPARTSSDGHDTVGPLVVGTVHDAASLGAALALGPSPLAPDLIELRVDHFAGRPEVLDPLVSKAPRPFIVTVRHPAEGGHGNLDSATRRNLYERFLPAARYVDIELGQLRKMCAVTDAARRLGCEVIASFHDFSGMPELRRLRPKIRSAARLQAQICKLAVRVDDPAGLARMIALLGEPAPLPLAVMGMGPLGRVSRLAAALTGSRLNYGYLGKVPQVPGQWPVAIMRERIEELAPDAAADRAGAGDEA